MDGAITAGTATTLRLQYPFEAAPERVFHAWTQPRALKLWWCPEGWHPTGIEVDLCVGGVFRIAMQRDDDLRRVSVHGRFLEVIPPTRLVYTWRWDGAFPDMPETYVTVDFRSIAAGTEVALRQEYLAVPLCTKHLIGWLAACGRIETVIAVPPAEPNLTGMTRFGVVAS